MIKRGGDNGEKFRKQQRGERDCRSFTLPPLTVHLQGNGIVIVCVHVCWENVKLKPAMKWDVGGIDFFLIFFLCQH